MDDDQQFCLRWNNHQSTLISVFDTLLENGTLVDCTLAAEGKFLKAHKVVLSACSPYFATLLSQQYDKHPIFILKDVKFQELRAMMDYMYRGEVNISQDQLAALLKAAESLQIKGLSDSRGNSTQSKDAAKPPPALAKASELKIENKRPMRSLGPEVDTDIGSREGSTSPTSRKRKKIRRRSIDTNNVDNHDQLSNSSSHSMPHNASLANQTQPHTNQISTTSSSATTNLQTPVTKKTEQQQKPESHNQHNKAESNNDMDETNDNDDDSETDAETPAVPAQKQPRKDGAKDGANNAELLLEPKNEYDDDDGQPVEDLTLDDEELLEEDMDEAGPSHGGEGSSQGGYAQWQMERSQDEAFMAAQEAGGQHRDAQGSILHKLLNNKYKPQDDRPARCPYCHRVYANAQKVQTHIKKYCLKQKKYQCMFCEYKSKRKDHIVRHTARLHTHQVEEKVKAGAIKSHYDAYLNLEAVKPEEENLDDVGGAGGPEFDDDYDDYDENFDEDGEIPFGLEPELVMHEQDDD